MSCIRNVFVKEDERVLISDGIFGSESTASSLSDGFTSGMNAASPHLQMGMIHHAQQPLMAQLLCIALLFQCSFAQRPDFKVLPGQKNRFWWWSSDAPMTMALDEIPEVVKGIEIILDHFKRLEERILSEMGSMVSINRGALLRPCKARDLTKWPRSIRAFAGIRGFPDPDISCITDFIGVQFERDEFPPYTVDQLYEAALRRGLATQANVMSIVSPLIDVETNFSGAAYPFNFRHSTTSANCVLHPVLGFRGDENWRTSTPIHSRPLEESVRRFQRNRLVEFHRVVDGHLTDNALMRLPVRPQNGTERIIREDATTLITGNRGDASPASFRFIPIAENPAIGESLDMAAIFISQAEDAVTPSNIAILALPLLLNLIPISLLSDVSTIQMLLYVLLSDVLTVLPLLIKGIELIQIQRRQHRSVVTRISSSLNLTRSEAAAAEMWAAECQVRDSVRIIGKIFVSLAVVFLVGGGLLELATRRYVRRRKFRSLLEESMAPDRLWMESMISASYSTDLKS